MSDTQKLYIGPTVTILTRHTSDCPKRGDKGYRQCNCWKALRWFDGKKQHVESTGSRTWAGAERAKREKETALDPHHVGPKTIPQSQTIKAAIASYITAKTSENNRNSTIRKWVYQLGQFETFMAARSKFYAHQITKEDLIEFRATWTTLDSGLSRQKAQTNLRGFLEWYCPDAQQIKSLLDTLKPIKLSRTDVHRLEPKPYTEREVERLLEQIPATFRYNTEKIAYMTTAVHCQVATGLAICDLMQLERAHIEDGWLRMRRQKTSRPVKQRLCADMHAELLMLAQEKYIFWDGEGSLESAIACHEDRLRRVMKAAGLYIKGNVSHRFRDTAVDFWTAEGWSLTDVADALGDTVAIVERHYKDMASKRNEQRIAKLPVRTWRKPEEISK